MKNYYTVYTVTEIWYHIGGGDSMAKGKGEDSRQLYVVKANDLIRKTRYDLTTQQQKILLYAISKIRRDDPPETEYEINIEELCDACGIDIDQTGGFYYQAIKRDLKTLHDNSMWVKMPDRSEVLVSWIQDAAIVPLCGTVYVTFNKRIAPYLFDLKEQYTQYKLENVLVFKGKYTIRLYEILRSYTTKRAIDEGREVEVMLSLDELRKRLMTAHYPRWVDFDRFILRPSVDEINACCEEMTVSYDTYKTGRAITKVNFIISSPRVKQMLEARYNKRQRLEVKKTKKKAAAPSGEQMRIAELEGDNKPE